MNLLNNLEIKKRIKDIFEGKEKINKEVNFLGSSFNEDEKLDFLTFLNVFSELNYQIEDKLYLTPKDSVFENKEVNNLIDKLVKIAILKNKPREGAIWYIKTKRKPTSYFIRKIAKDLKTSSFGSNNNLLIFNWDEKDQFLFVFPFFTLNQIELRKLQIDKNNLYQTDLEVLSNIFIADEKVFIQKLWLEAFNVEKVSRKFFLEYLDIFKKLMIDLEKQNSHLKYSLFSEKSKIENFAKILLGRLMFLYFIQKKGWLNCYGAWGTGDKRFLFNKFKEAKKLGKNYFKDYLEPLFFETLNNPDRNKADNSTRFGGRIPFLNGGLFEPNYPYKDLAYKVILNNETFEYIFEVFESYNFTVKEDEPLEKEVAVDPEMLGKVFENLIEENLRKGKGAFYTPREIVSYMSHQSLVYYLSQELNIEEFKIKKFLETKGESYKEDLKSKAKDIIDKLKSIKIVDPACGSGAFLIGVLHEILEARLLVNKLVDKKETQSLYQIKKEIIENNIYGVDIDEGAVEIAKLRLWLSLVVDHDLSEIDPLPNLDYKIMVGNSLVDSILINKKQIKLFDYYYFKEKKKENYKNLFEKSVVVDLFEQNLYESEIKLIVEKIRVKKIKLFETSDFKEKLSLRKEINKLENELIKKSLKKEYEEINSRLVNDRSINLAEKTQLEMIREELNNLINNEDNLNLYKKQNIFLWELNFIEVFDEKDGFDIVIANPPYISTKAIDEKIKPLLQESYNFVDDLYNHFFFKGINLLKKSGIIVYITSKTFWTIQTKKNLRELLLNNTILQFFDTANPFESAMVDTCLIIVKKTSPIKEHLVIFLDGKKSILEPKKYTIHQSIYNNTPNKVFFIPTDYNKKICERFGKKVNELINQWWDKISTSKNIDKYRDELNNYRKSLKPGDVTLLGLITEGGQGLATANNGKYVGVLDGTKWAENVKKQRPEKLLLATEFCKKENIKTKADAQQFLNTLSEQEIRQLFDSLKEKYGRDIFGQGWLYRIVNKNEIANVDVLTDDEKLNGIAGTKTYVPYDKGDKDGNRWYAPTPYYIDWSRENVKFLKENSGKKGEGMPVVRNPQFYFREGFCWSFALLPQKQESMFIKARIKIKSINDVMSMAMYNNYFGTSNKYFVSILNSKFMYNYLKYFVNSTAGQQLNDFRQLPIIIPTVEQLKEFEEIFNRAYNIQKSKFEGKISEVEAETQLKLVQKELDEMVEDMYMG